MDTVLWSKMSKSTILWLNNPETVCYKEVKTIRLTHILMIHIMLIISSFPHHPVTLRNGMTAGSSPSLGRSRTFHPSTGSRLFLKVPNHTAYLWRVAKMCFLDLCLIFLVWCLCVWKPCTFTECKTCRTAIWKALNTTKSQFPIMSSN